MDDQSSKPQTAVSWAFKAAKKYKTAVRFVLVALAEFIEQGNACPSHKDIAAETGLAKSTVQGALGELEKEGLIERAKNGGSKVRGGKTNCYHLVGWEATPTSAGGTPSESNPPESVQGESVPLKSTLVAEPVEYAPAHTYTGGDAAGEKDMSLRAKEKDKKPFSPSDAGESKGARKKSVRSPREPNPLFDAIAWHIFDFLPTETEAISAAGGRIGEMLRDFPANKTMLTPERIAHFGRWWNLNKRDHTGKSISKPLTAGKLARHWSDFERANPVRTTVSQQAAQQRETENREYLEQEHRRIQREMLGVPS